jgi:cell division protein ZapA
MAMIEKSPTAETKPQSRATTYEVVIAGVPLRLKSPYDEKTVNELVALVDQKVKEALPLTKTGSIQNAAILASLHLAEEYFMLKRKASGELDKLEARTVKVISELESSRVTGLGNGSRTEKFGEDSGSSTADV